MREVLEDVAQAYREASANRGQEMIVVDINFQGQAEQERGPKILLRVGRQASFFLFAFQNLKSDRSLQSLMLSAEGLSAI